MPKDGVLRAPLVGVVIMVWSRYLIFGSWILGSIVLHGLRVQLVLFFVRGERPKERTNLRIFSLAERPKTRGIPEGAAFCSRVFVGPLFV